MLTVNQVYERYEADVDQWDVDAHGFVPFIKYFLFELVALILTRRALKIKSITSASIITLSDARDPARDWSPRRITVR